MGFERIDPPADLRAFILAVVDEFREVEEIWLFGSRAEGVASISSDWDLVAFSNDRLTPTKVARATHLRDDRFELFVAHGDAFIRPWRRKKDRAILEGSFARWQWRVTGDGKATYDASAEKPNRTSGLKPAFRIWRRTD